MRIGILQPGYLPWLGFFEQLYKSDAFVIYDDVQFDKNGWRNRNRIKTANGVQWLTVPVHVKFDEHPLVKDVLIDNSQNWKNKHLLSIKYNYAKAEFYNDYIGIFEEAFAKEWQNLIDLDMYFINKIAESLGVDTKKIVKSSTLNIQGERIERLINICKFFKVDTFYEGAAGKNYIKMSDFEKQGIKVEFQDYKHPIYKQLYGDFVPHLSVIDLLFNEGQRSLAILLNQV